MGKRVVVIEHLEELYSVWLEIEYRESSKIVGQENIIFTNVKDNTLKDKLKRYGSVKCESIVDIYEEQFEKTIVLDPKCDEPLKPEDFDFKGDLAIVVGGILGDHPPKGRTWNLLTSRMPNAIARSLGKYQYPIYCAVYVAWEVAKGKRLDEIPVVYGVELEVKRGKDLIHTIYLPYAYPIVNGEAYIPKSLKDYLARKIVYYEITLLSEG